MKNSAVVLDRPWLRVEEQHVALPTGAEIEQFHLLRSPDWASVLALTPTGYVVVVDQYRHGLGRVSRELPAGVVDEGETPEAAARRELLEETGYVAEHWRELMVVAPEPNRSTHLGHFFFATRAERAAEPSLDASEQLAAQLVPVEELVAAATAGELPHCAHVAAILAAERRGWLAPEGAQ